MDMPVYPVEMWGRRHLFDFVLPNEKVGNGNKRRHIGSLKKTELERLGWDGMRNMSHSQGGNWVPFIRGYDSDSDYEYEPICGGNSLLVINWDCLNVIYFPFFY